MKLHYLILINLLVLIGHHLSFAAETQADKQASNITHTQKENMSENFVPAEILPLPNQANQAALALQRLGFRILHIGTTISVQATPLLWQSTFNVSFEVQKKMILPETNQEVTYFKAITDKLQIPDHLQALVAEVTFVEPPEFYQK
jgi:hypothetical protein